MVRYLSLLALCLTTAFGQAELPRFEVASIRKSADNNIRAATRSGGPGTTSPDQIVWRFQFTGMLVMEAFGVPYSRIKGPQRIMYGSTDTPWDIQATLPAGSKLEDVPKMLQALLVDRFALKAHWEVEERPIYRMIVDKGGIKLKLEESDGGRAFTTLDRAPGGGTLIHATRMSMKSVAAFAEARLGEPGAIVVDETGLTGVFTADLAYDDLKTALQQDWGLRLERGKGPVQVLVVDSIREEPTEN